MEKENWFKQKKVTGGFGLVALATGFLLLNKGITGYATSEVQNTLNSISLIGLLLILCSGILAAYSIKKR